jgi:hypothetical protein
MPGNTWTKESFEEAAGVMVSDEFWQRWAVTLQGCDGSGSQWDAIVATAKEIQSPAMMVREQKTWTKESFEEAAGVMVSDEFWQRWAVMLQGCDGSGLLWDGLVTTAKEIQSLAMVREQNTWSQKKQYLVLSTSTAARDETTRKEFREKQVGPEPCRGGFVAQQFYVDFVFAAREFQELEAKDNVVSVVKGLANILKDRKEFSMFSNAYLDEESPQSGVASELFRLAIDLLGTKEMNEHCLRVTHQQSLVSNADCKEGALYGIIQKKRRLTVPQRKHERSLTIELISVCGSYILTNCSVHVCWQQSNTDLIQEAKRSARCKQTCMPVTLQFFIRSHVLLLT